MNENRLKDEIEKQKQIQNRMIIQIVVVSCIYLILTGIVHYFFRAKGTNTTMADQVKQFLYTLLLLPLIIITLCLDAIRIIILKLRKQKEVTLEDTFTKNIFNVGNVPNRNDWIVIFSNVLFFMVVQTFFFRYVVSKQYENVLVSKLQMVKTLVSKNESVKQQVEEFKQNTIAKYKDIAVEKEIKRNIENKKLTFQYCWSLIIIVTTILTGLAIYSIYGHLSGSHKWTLPDTLNILFVLLAYSTEVFFYFFIVRKYEFVGDNYIITNVLQHKLNELCPN
jgi:hypothetical protein